MSNSKKPTIELRTYQLNPYFPVKLLTGSHWHISDVPADVLHFHNCLEIGLCHSAEGIIEFGDISLPFHAGDISVISRDLPHTTYSVRGAASLWSYLFVDLSLLLHPHSAISTAAEQDVFQKIENNFRMLMGREAYPFIYSIVKELIYEVEMEKLFYEDSVRGLFSTLAVKLLREHEKQPEGSIPPAANLFPIKPALDFIKNYYMQDFDILTLAKACDLSESHFRRIFSEITGRTPLEYVNRLRIEKACCLLRISGLSVLNISEAVGFGSLSSFNRHFADIMGITPSAYRMQNAVYKDNASVTEYSGWLMPEKL